MASERRIKKQNFIAKDPITAIASFFLFFGNIIKYYFLSKNSGRVGMGIYTSVLFFNLLFIFIFAKSMFEVTKNGINYRRERGRYKNAKQIIHTNCILALIIGAIISLLLIILSSFICDKLFDFGSYGNLALVFIILANPFIMYCCTGFAAFRSYSYNTAIGFSIIIFSISNLVSSLLFGKIFGNKGVSHSELLHNINVNYAFYATGCAFGFLLSILITSLFVMFFIKNLQKNIRTNNSNEYGKSRETFKDQIKGFFTVIFPPLFQYGIMMIPFIVTMVLYFKLPFWKDNATILNSGEFLSNSFASVFDSFVLWLVLPTILTVILGNYSKDYLSKVYERNDRYHVGMRLVFSIKSFLCVPAIFYVYGAIVSPSISGSLYETEITGITFYFALLSILCGLSILFCYFAKGLNKLKYTLIASSIAAIIEVLLAYFLLVKDSSIYSLLKAFIVYFIVLSVSLFVLLRRYFVYKKHKIRHLVYPFVSIVIYGLSIFIIMFIKNAVGAVIAAILSFVIGLVIHSITLVLSGCIKPGESQELPQGNLIMLLSNLMGIRQTNKRN